MSRFFVGLDLGQSKDYTALAVVELVEIPTGEYLQYLGKEKTIAHHYLRHLERFKLGTPYPAVVERLHELLASQPLKGKNRLVVDATGVGAPVVDLLRQGGLSPIAITITGGDAATNEGANWRVPKRDLVSAVQVLLQTGRLKVAEGLQLAPLLVQELLNFQVKITANAHDTYRAWREGVRDDLVLAVSLACWYGERAGRGLGIWFL